MTLADGYTKVPAGKVAFIATSLEMLAKPLPRPVPEAKGLTIRAVASPDVEWYRALYTRVGAEWLWASRLKLSSGDLAAIIQHPKVELSALQAAGHDEGLLELDFRVDGECELAFFGVTAAMIGRGAGRALMSHAIEKAWSRPIRRFWVHTCTGDHPAALQFYMRSGFVPFERRVEIADDPRLNGLLPEMVAAHVPIVRKA
ncbi:MAG: GNAT family N-acetyltransferase [Hyphomicrobiaceae bacterium]